MKTLKRLGGALIALLALTVMLTGTALAAEPAQKGIGVQLNGESLTFTDAVPEITGDRTFVPFRAVLEAMGAKVDYDPQTRTVSAQRDGVTVTMVPGRKELNVTEDGQTRAVEMDVAPYIKESNGRTYLPIRYAAEVLGYTVGWDGVSRTVIIVDVDALFGDATFGLMDNFAAYCDKQKAAENMTVTGSLNLDMTDKTGKLGSEPIKIGGSIDGVIGNKGAQLTGRLDLSGLDGLAGMSGGTPMEQAMIKAMLEALSDMTAELRLDLEKGMLYLSLPAELTGKENTWYSVDFAAYQAELLSALDMSRIAQLEGAGVRDSLVWVMENMPLDDADASYAALSEMARLYTGMLSDQAFTQKGGDYVAHIVLEDILTTDITLTKRGADIVAVDLVMTASADGDGVRMTMKVTEHAAPDKVTVDMDIAAEDADTAAVRLTMNLSCVPTQKAPLVTPPDGVEITPMA